MTKSEPTMKLLLVVWVNLAMATGGGYVRSVSGDLDLEEIYFHVLNHLFQKTKEKNLCLAGGVAFNGVANGKITKNTPFQNVCPIRETD